MALTELPSANRARAVLLRPLRFAEARQLARVWDTFRTPGNLGPVSYVNFEDWRRWSRSFSAMAACTGSSAVLTGAGKAMRLTRVAASANLFEVLGVQPAFRPEEDRPRDPDFWMTALRWRRSRSSAGCRLWTRSGGGGRSGDA